MTIGGQWGVVAMVAALAVAAGCSRDADVAPYLWPTPPDNVAWTKKTFEIRYSDWHNSEAEVREAVARWCGPAFDSARVYPHAYTGSLMHPQSLTVVCGNPQPPAPEFRGQVVPDSMLWSLKPSAAVGSK